MLFRRLTAAGILSLFILSACRKEQTASPENSISAPTDVPVAGPCFPPADNDNLFLGNPTNAERFLLYPNNYLLDHTYFSLGYSNARGIPLWVSWHLEADDLGATPRQNDFREDENLDAGVFYRVPSWAFSGSGFDRGHNCPSADRTASVDANSATFLMTNMIPQSPKFNQGPWAGLENYIRNTLVGTNSEAFIVMGSYGAGGVATTSMVYTLDNDRVTVPEKVFKIALIIPKGNSDFSRVDTSAKILAVTMPNDNRLYSTTGQSVWRNYRTTIAAIESDAELRGIEYDLLRNISDTVVKHYLKQKVSVN